MTIGRRSGLLLGLSPRKEWGAPARMERARRLRRNMRFGKGTMMPIILVGTSPKDRFAAHREDVPVDDPKGKLHDFKAIGIQSHQMDRSELGSSPPEPLGKSPKGAIVDVKSAGEIEDP